MYLDELLGECVRSLRVIAAVRDVHIHLCAMPDVLADADDVLIRRLFTNLIENAVKHTPDSGSVSVTLTAEGQMATIAVADTGPGVPEADRERIFERFVRLDPARQASGGAGLGLPIALWIAKLHGGRLIVRPGPAGGSEFIGTLTLEAPPMAGRDTGTSDDHGIRGPSQTIGTSVTSCQ